MYDILLQWIMKFNIDGVESPELTLLRGSTYIFDQKDDTNTSHRLQFYLSDNNDSNNEYDTGVNIVGNSSQNTNDANPQRYTQITVPYDAPSEIWYQCSSHPNMGGKINISDGGNWYIREDGDISGNDVSFNTLFVIKDISASQWYIEEMAI